MSDLNPFDPPPTTPESIREEKVLVQPKTPSKTAFAIAAGFSAFLALYVGSTALMKSYGPAFFSIPFFAGFVVGVLSPRNPIRNASIAVALALLALIATLREGVVCILFALPLFLAEMTVGVLCGVIVRRWADSRRKQVTAVISALIAALGWQAISGRLDDPKEHPWHTVSSRVEIDAPPERVFDALTGEIGAKGPWPWIIRLGLPTPRRMVVEKPGLGGTVRTDFNHGHAYARITSWEPGRAFAFQVERYDIEDPPFFITRLGRGEHYGLKTERVTDWLTLGEIRYTLTPRDGGGTTLSRTTTFQRHLAPALYFGPLEEGVMQRGQDRLLRAIQEDVDGRPSDGVAGR